MKKVFQTIIIIFIITIVGTINVSAKELSITEIGNKLDEQLGEQDRVDYAYVIGDYVFAKKSLTLEDVMLAARTIKMDEETESDYNAAKGEMYIAYIEREYDLNAKPPKETGKWVLTGDLIKEDHQLPDKIEVNHIDGEIVKESSEFTVDTEITKFADKLQEQGFSGNENYSDGLTLSNGALTGTIYKKTLEKETFKNGNATNYYFAFKITVPQANKKTTVKLTGEKSYVFSQESFENNTEAVVLWALDNNATNKTIKIEVDVDGAGEKYTPKEYIIDYSKVVFQQESTLTLSTAFSEKDKEELKKQGFTFSDKYTYQINNLNVTGKVIQQLMPKGLFTDKDNGEEGYYLAFNLAPSKIEDGLEIVIGSKKITYADFQQNGKEHSYVTYLHKLDTNCSGDNCKITISVDYDGENGKEYLATNYDLIYSSLDYLSRNVVTYKDNDGKVLHEDVFYEGEIPKLYNIALDDYHTFDYWVNEDSQYIPKNLAKDEDIVLTPHLTLKNIDEYVTKKIAENNENEVLSEKIKFEKSEKNIILDVLRGALSIDELKNTNIMKIIYEIIDKNEITEIKIKIDDNHEVIFNKSNTISTEMIEEEFIKLFDDANLSTLDDAVRNNINLTISVNKTAENITNINDTYTMKFISDFRVVNSLEELENVLNNIDVDIIYINNDITLNKNSDTIATFTISTDRQLLIKSVDKNHIRKISLIDSNFKDEFNPDKEPVISVVKGNVTFEDLYISGGSTAIKIGGASDKAVVTLANVTAIDNKNSGFDVKSNAELIVENGQNIFYKATSGENLIDKESYHYPIICGEGTVKISGLTKVQNYERIIRNVSDTWQESDFKDPENPDSGYFSEFLNEDKTDLAEEYKNLIGKKTKDHMDYLVKTGHTHYYQNAKNSRYYTFHFWDNRIRLIVKRYFAEGDKIIAPEDNSYNTLDYSNALFFFRKAFVDKETGKTLVHDGWAETEDKLNSVKVEEFKYPSNFDTPKSYYRHFSEGYMIEIPIEVNDIEKNGVFGLLKNNEEQVTIQNLIESDSEFAKAWNELKEKAKKEENKDIYDLNGNIEGVVSEDSVVTNNIKLDVIEPTKANIALASDSEDYNLSNNSLSGDLFANKFAINVNIPNVEANKSTITVTNPNNEVKTIKASSENTKIELAAITSSMLNKNANKVYKIAIDADGEESNFGPKVINIDYGKLTLAEETINYAATNTLNAESLAYKNRGHFKGEDRLIDVVYQKGNYNTQYYKEYSKSGDNLNPKYEVYYYNPEGHTFVEYAKYKKLSRHEKTLAYTVALSKDCENELQSDSITHKTEDGYYLNGFRYVNNDYHGMGLTELKLLVDVTDDSRIEALNSVERVKKEDGYDLYKVSVSSDRINEWLDNNYDAYNNSGTSVTDGDYLIEDAITLMVEVSDSGYITKIYTQSGDEFSYRRATKTDKEADYYRYNDNKFDITISDINETVVPDIYTVLNIQEQTDEEGNVVKNKENIVKEFLKSAGYNRNLEQ